MSTARGDSPERPHARDDRGAAGASSFAVVASVVVLAAALIGFMASGEAPRPPGLTTHPVAVDKTPKAGDSNRAAHHPTTHQRSRHGNGGKQSAPQQPRRVPSVYVEVYNNGGNSGAATSAAARLQAVGWQVVGTDDWYGDIPASTVYYPSLAYKAAAQRLAKTAGIERLWPAVSPMRFDRLTVILTADYSG